MNFVLVAVVSVCFASVCCDEVYSTKFKNIDLDEILKNDRLLNAYHKCILDGEGCTPEGEELRKVIPDAIETGCAKCTDEQKAGAKKVVTFLIKEKPDLWETLVNKFDPDNIFREKFKEQLQAQGLEV